MRLIYPIKIVQTAVALVCVYALLRGRDLCSERGQKQFDDEIKTALSTSQGQQPCTITIVHDFNRINLTRGDETRLVRTKRYHGSARILPTDNDDMSSRLKGRRSLDIQKTDSPNESLGETVKLIEKEELTTKEPVEEKTVKSTEMPVKEEIIKETIPVTLTEPAEEPNGLPVKNESRVESIGTTKKEEAVETTETHLEPVRKESRIDTSMETVATHTVPVNEESGVKSEEAESGQEVVTTATKSASKIAESESKKLSRWKRLFDERGSYWHKTCMSVNLGLTVDWNLLPLFPIWLAVIFFLLDVALLQLELGYSCYTEKEQSRKGVWLLGSLHFILLTGAVGSLLYIRLNWQKIWPKEHLLETPHYPSDWFDTELVALLLVVCHMLEMVFYRVCRGSVVLCHQMDYNVAQKESEMRTYVSAFEVPLDGSYEL